jgi:hypothetical protein
MDFQNILHKQQTDKTITSTKDQKAKVEDLFMT